LSNFVPATSIEFQVLTTNPAFGTEDLEVNKLFDEQGNIIPSKVLMFFTRDWRLGNLNPKLHDINYIWHYPSNAVHIALLRNGAFLQVSLMMISTVASMTETSQSIGGFFRKNAQSTYASQEYSERGQQQPGWFGKIFGGK
jgi:hypothetical protein